MVYVVIWGYSDSWSYVVIKGYNWVCGIIVVRICVDVFWFVLLLKVMWMFMVYVVV